MDILKQRCRQADRDVRRQAETDIQTEITLTEMQAGRDAHSRHRKRCRQAEIHVDRDAGRQAEMHVDRDAGRQRCT